MDILLIGGLWLDGSAWRDVAAELGRLGHRPVPLTLPGQGDGSASATLDDQVDAVVAAVDTASGPCVVVGHSAACTLAWLAADRRPDRVGRVVLVGGIPMPDGQPYAPFFPAVDGVVPFPGWAAFAGQADDLTEAQKDAVATGGVTVPEAVAYGTVRYTDERRGDRPVVMICPEYTPEEARVWIDGGDVPELAGVDSLALVDLDSGHWPMFSEPVELARLIADAAG